MIEPGDPAAPAADRNQRGVLGDDVRAAIDNQAISDLLVRYVHALDDRDWAAVEHCFTADALFTHPGGDVKGAAGIVRRARAALEALDASQHLLASVAVTIGHDAAQATSYFHAQHIRAGTPGGDLYVIAGTYRDRLQRRDAGWAIVERIQTYTWRSGNPDVIVRDRTSEGQS